MLNFDSPAFTAIQDQADAALNDMPDDVRQLLVGQYLDEILTTLVPFFIQLGTALHPVMSSSANEWYRSTVAEGMRLAAKAALIQNKVIEPKIRALAVDPTLPRDQIQLDDDKLEELAEYVTSHEEKFLQVFAAFDALKFD